MKKTFLSYALLALIIISIIPAAFPKTAAAASGDEVCDSSHENCRDPLLALIKNETVGIDWGFWFIKDYRYVNAVIARFKAGVPVRIIMDPRANTKTPENATYLKQLSDAGIPMRKRTAGDISHWKLMIFRGQNVIEWSGANFSSIAFVPDDPYKNYEDEVISFTRSPLILNSFKTQYDNVWTNTTQYATYANVSGPLTRAYPTTAIDSRLNFPPDDSYFDRLVPLIDKENKLIDVDMFRLTASPPVDALIRAAARGVRERLYFEPTEYSNPDRPGNKVQIDKLVAAAQKYPGTIEIRMRAHYGLNHQKTVMLHGQHIVVFGTSNWSDASDDNQLEANIFTDKDPGDGVNDFLFNTLLGIFERKFYNTNPISAVETKAYKTPSLPRPGTTPPPPTPTPTPLPAGWLNMDIGSVGKTGNTSYNGTTQTFTVNGAGADIWGTADAFQYTYTSLTGDGSIVARVDSVSTQNAWVKAGVMIRETLTPSSKQALMLVSYTKGLAFQRRIETAGISTNTSGGTFSAPRWVKIDRAGTTITAFQSADGTNWTPVGTDTISMATQVYIGLAVSSHTTSSLATATFSNVSITPR
jgi:phosphatidylserine/phosphatidylglycerophosphate/cardiolipin synthase-like enzyme/regulation of enolase protein 1 (concanavalin A-like superfamily)